MADFTLANIQAIDRAVSKIFMDSMKDAPKDHLKIAMVEKSNSRTTDYAWLGDIPMVREWIGARQLATLKDYKYQITKKDFESSFSIKRDDILFDQLGSVKIKTQSLAHALPEHQDELVFGLIGANGNAYDGKKFFSTTHDVNGTAVSNKSTKKLSNDELWTTRAKMMEIKSDSGRTLPIKPNLLVVGASLEQTARKIIQTSNKAGGETNETHGLVDILVSPYMAADHWCLLDTTKPVKPFILNIVHMGTPTRSDQDLWKSKTIHYGVDGMYNSGYGLWQLAHFSDGSTT